MTTETEQKLIAWARQYNNRALFLQNDPVQVPNHYRNGRLQDLEISAFLTSYLSFGNRKQIVKSALRLDEIMNHSPYDYVLSKRWEKDFSSDNTASFYRTVSYQAMNALFQRLSDIYTHHKTMEEACFTIQGDRPFNKICTLFGVSDKSPQKKINMFLRWMVRTDGIVDFGAWKCFNPKDLIIPLDTHVAQMAEKLGLVKSKSYSLKTALTITDALANIFPGDPCLGDFALFGYGVEND